MNTSSEFRISSILLMAATVVCLGLAAAIVLPRLYGSPEWRAATAIVDQGADVVSGNEAERYGEFQPENRDVQIGDDLLVQAEVGTGRQKSTKPENSDDEADWQQAAFALDDDPFAEPVKVEHVRDNSVNRSHQVAASRILTPAPEIVPVETAIDTIAVAEPETEDTSQRDSLVFFGGQQERVEASSETASEPPRHSVHVPVTVNIDGSVLSAELSRFNERLDQLLTDRQQATSRPEKPRRDRQPRRARVPVNSVGTESGVQASRNAESLERLDDDIAALSGSLRQFRQETTTAIGNLSLQVNNANAESRLLEALRIAMAERSSPGHVYIVDSRDDTRLAQRNAENTRPSQDALARVVELVPEADGVPAPQNLPDSRVSEFDVKRVENQDQPPRVPAPPKEKPELLFFGGAEEADVPEEKSQPPAPVSQQLDSTPDVVDQPKDLFLIPETTKVSTPVLEASPKEPESWQSEVNNPFPPVKSVAEGEVYASDVSFVQVTAPETATTGEDEVVDPVVFRHTYRFDVPDAETIPQTEPARQVRSVTAAISRPQPAQPQVQHIEETKLNPMQKGLRAIRSARWVPDVDMPQWMTKLPEAAPVKAVRNSQWLHRLSSTIRRTPSERVVE